MHLNDIKNFVAHHLDAKYRKGQAEHGGNLWDRNPVEDIQDEAIDLITYVFCIKERDIHLLGLATRALDELNHSSTCSTLRGRSHLTALIETLKQNNKTQNMETKDTTIGIKADENYDKTAMVNELRAGAKGSRSLPKAVIIYTAAVILTISAVWVTSASDSSVKQLRSALANNTSAENQNWGAQIQANNAIAAKLKSIEDENKKLRAEVVRLNAVTFKKHSK